MRVLTDLTDDPHCLYILLNEVMEKVIIITLRDIPVISPGLQPPPSPAQEKIKATEIIPHTPKIISLS